MSAENQWLEDVFLGDMLVFGGVDDTHLEVLPSSPLRVFLSKKGSRIVLFQPSILVGAFPSRTWRLWHSN